MTNSLYAFRRTSPIIITIAPAAANIHERMGLFFNLLLPYLEEFFLERVLNLGQFMLGFNALRTSFLLNG